MYQCLVNIVLLAILSCSSAMAQVYKWTDEKGGVHYGNIPPSASHQSLDIKTAPPTKVPYPASGPSRADIMLQEAERLRALREREEQPRETPAEKPVNKLCQQASEKIFNSTDWRFGGPNKQAQLLKQINRLCGRTSPQEARQDDLEEKIEEAERKARFAEIEKNSAESAARQAEMDANQAKREADQAKHKAERAKQQAIWGETW